MEKITSRAALIEGLENLRALEITARDSYMEDIMTFHNVELIQTIEKIKDDEIKHIKMIEELLTMLK